MENGFLFMVEARQLEPWVSNTQSKLDTKSSLLPLYTIMSSSNLGELMQSSTTRTLRRHQKSESSPGISLGTLGIPMATTLQPSTAPTLFRVRQADISEPFL
jgi:hypothetical protein